MTKIRFVYLESFKDLDKHFVIFRAKKLGIPNVAFSFLQPDAIYYSGAWFSSKHRALSQTDPQLYDIISLGDGLTIKVPKSKTPAQAPDTKYKFDPDITNILKDIPNVELGDQSVPSPELAHLYKDGESTAQSRGSQADVTNVQQGILATVGGVLSSSTNYVAENLKGALNFAADLPLRFTQTLSNIALEGVDRVSQSVSRFVSTTLHSSSGALTSVAKGVGEGLSQTAKGVGVGLNTAFQGVGSGAAMATEGLGRGIGQGGAKLIGSASTGVSSILSGNSGVTLLLVAGLFAWSQKK